MKIKSRKKRKEKKKLDSDGGGWQAEKTGLDWVSTRSQRFLDNVSDAHLGETEANPLVRYWR